MFASQVSASAMCKLQASTTCLYIRVWCVPVHPNVCVDRCVKISGCVPCGAAVRPRPLVAIFQGGFSLHNSRTLLRRMLSFWWRPVFRVWPSVLWGRWQNLALVSSACPLPLQLPVQCHSHASSAMGCREAAAGVEEACGVQEWRCAVLSRLTVLPTRGAQ